MNKDLILHTIVQRLVRHVRTLSPSRANSQYVPYVLRTMLMLLMMVVGVTTAWGQTPDYSGVYYIANAIWNGDHDQSTESGYEDYWYDLNKPNKNWYLVPGDNPQRNNKEDAWYSPNYSTQNGDPERPFLTTYRTNRDNNSVWIIKKTGNLYYIIHALTGKYVKYEPPYTGGNVHRKAIHLETWSDPDNDPGDVFKYEITTNTNTSSSVTGFNIRYPGTLAGGTHRHFNPAGDNWEYYYGTTGKSPYSGGMVGFYTADADNIKGGLWPHEDAKAALTPTISDLDEETGEFTITCGFVPTGCTLKYTIDGTNPSASNGTAYSGAVTITGACEVKAAVVGYGMVLSNISSMSFSPVAAPMVTNDYSGNISLSTTSPNAVIYYTLDGTTPSSSNGTLYSSAFSLGDATVIKAIAYNHAGTLSSEVTIYNVPQYDAPTIGFNSSTSKVTITSEGTVYYTTDGSTPTTSSIEYIAPFTVSSGATIKAIAIHAGYLTSEVATLSIAQVATPTITINADNSVTITCDTEGATIYYKTGGDDPTMENATQSASIACILPSQGPIKAFAIKADYLHSDIATESSIPAKIITVSSSNGSLTSADPIVYDGTAHQPAFTITEGETTISSEEYTSVYSDNTNAGTATITITDNEDGDYNVSGSFTFTIAQKALTITADAKSKTYGDADPTLTYTSEGLINDDAITGTLARAAGENAGTYAITQNTLTAGNNYSISYTGANLTINKAALTVTANNHTITYGDVPADNGVTYGEFVGEETAAVLGGTLDYDFSYTQYGDVGNTYTITPKGLTSGNYEITYAAGTLTVNPKVVGLTWENTVFTYDGEEHAPTATATGLVNSNVIGVTVTGAQTDAGENYTATASSLTGEKKDNYTLPEGLTQAFTIAPKSIGDDTDPAENITIDITEANTAHVFVKQGGKKLTAGTDYSISATGDATTKYYKVTITGANNYTGSFEATFANVAFSKLEGSSTPGGAGTFVSTSSDGDFVVPDNMKAYIVTGINTAAGIVLTEGPLDNIPKQVPVLLLSTVDANGFMVKAKDGGTAPTGTNLLKVESTSKTVSTAEIYLLYKGEFVLNAVGTLPAGKVYLQKPGGAPAPARLRIDWGGASGIEEVLFSTPDSLLSTGWYTLEGIKLNSRPTKKGIYIQNGKKVIIK